MLFQGRQEIILFQLEVTQGKISVFLKVFLYFAWFQGYVFTFSEKVIGYDLKFPISKINSSLQRKYTFTCHMPGIMRRARDTKIIGSVTAFQECSSTKEESWYIVVKYMRCALVYLYSMCPQKVERCDKTIFSGTKNDENEEVAP